jgi:acyl-lipid omega-6 desaturase (Delta-12 desaturase)
MPQLDQIISATKAFQAPILARSLGQLATSFGGFFSTCAAMYLCLTVSLWITLPISVLAAGFLVRIFIIQHDCGHGSFFRSRWANELMAACAA